MRIVSLLPVLLLAACASTPKAPATAGAPAPTPPPVMPTSATAPTRMAAAAPARAADPAEAATKPFDQIDAANLAEAQAAGYKVVNEKGNTLLCKKSLLTGTRLQYVTTCLTAMEWKETSQAAKEAVKPSPIYKPYRGN